MTKKALIISMLAVFGTFSANASGSVISSTELSKYEDALKFLNCSYTGSVGCGDAFSSTDSARDVIKDLKNKTATGLNSSKKAALDTAANAELLKISVDDLKGFYNGLEGVDARGSLKYLTDDVKIVTSVRMPSIDSTESFDPKNIESLVTTQGKAQVSYYSKKDIAAAAEVVTLEAANQPYKQMSPAYAGVKFSTEGEKNFNYKVSNNFLDGEIATTQVNKTPSTAMETTTTIIVKVRRYANENYEIRIYENLMAYDSKLDKKVFTDSPDVQLEFKVPGSLVDSKMDEGWVYRYKDQEEARRKEDTIYGNREMLRYTADRALRHMDRAYRYDRALMLSKLTDEQLAGLHETLTGYYKGLGYDSVRSNPAKYQALAKKELDEARKVYKAGMDYYPEVQSYTDEDSRSVVSYYNSVDVDGYDQLRQKRYNEEMQVDRAVTGFKVYLN